MLAEVLNKLDFIVVADIFHTPTTIALADIVLPATTYSERDGLRGDWFRAGVMNRVIEPIGECRSDQQMCLELGRRFNPEACPWENIQEMYTGMLEESGATFEEWRDSRDWYNKYIYKKHEKATNRPGGQPGFMTGTGRVELYSPLFESWGIDPLPFFAEPAQSPLSTPELYKEYPLVLTTGARDWASFHSEHRQVPRLRRLKQDPTVEIHPETAAAYGINNGDWVWIENTLGRAYRKTKITPIVDPRVVACDHGWWLPEKKAAAPSLYSAYDINHWFRGM